MIGTAKRTAGAIERGHVDLGFYPDGSPIRSPVLVAGGRKDGPTLMVQACIHGPEVVGPLSIQRFLKTLDLNKLSGTIVCLMEANPLGFNGRSRLTPQDGFNLNRVFPGDPNGHLSEQLAHQLLQLTLSTADALLDLQRHQQIVIHEKIAAAPANWQTLRSRATRLIDNALSKNPERLGYNLSDLRAALRDKSTDVFEALMADLCSSDFVRRESFIRRRSHRPALPVKLQPLAEKIHENLSRKPFDPPPRRELERDSEEQRALKFLIESGKVIDEVEKGYRLGEKVIRYAKVVVAQ